MVNVLFKLKIVKFIISMVSASLVTLDLILSLMVAVNLGQALLVKLSQDKLVSWELLDSWP